MVVDWRVEVSLSTRVVEINFEVAWKSQNARLRSIYTIDEFRYYFLFASNVVILNVDNDTNICTYLFINIYNAIKK